MKGLLLLFAVFLYAAPARSEGIVFCYWGPWAISRPGAGRYGVSDLPTDLCTHIVYTFIGLNAEADLTYPEENTIEGSTNTIKEFIKLKESNEDLKLLIAIGGWTEGSINFSIVTNDDTLRAKLVKNLVSYIDEQGFDGLDLDWEYPAQRGGNETDKESFIWLLQDLRTAFEEQGEGWVLSTAVGVTQYAIETSYNVPKISEYVDYINLMTYDLHGSWDAVTGVNSPLYPQLTDDPTNTLNVNSSVYNWINSGADPAKLVLGLAAYGRTFNLISLDNTGTGAPSDGPGAAGKYTQEAGTQAYYEICLNQLENVWNITEVAGSYVYGNTGSLWVGYDNANTIYAKGRYASQLGLAGIMVWSTDQDDFSGLCSTTTYPLIRKGVEGLRASANDKIVPTVLVLTTAMAQWLVRLRV